MDDGYEATQALHFDDSGDETDDDDNQERPPVGYLKVLCQKGYPEESFPLREGNNVIGRHESCDISIPLKGLSREHACIEVKGESVFIFDKSSRNRTRRNKHFLTPEVRYELRDSDKLTFGDVDCVYQAEQRDNNGDDNGSETGSESMFETAPIDQVNEEPTQGSTLKLPADADYHSDGSSDILEPTQPFGSQKQPGLGNNNSTLTDNNRTHNITVKDIPAPTKTKKITDNLVLPESGSETDEEDTSAGAPTLAVESQHSDDESPRRAIMGAPTQAYVCESDEDTEEEVTPRKRSLMMAATQAFVGEEEEVEGDSPKKEAILTAATQAYVAESDETGDEEENPVKPKKVTVDPTQKYTLAAGIEPTQAYNMDEESNDGSKEETEESPSKSKALMFQPTQAYVGGGEVEEEEEDSNQGETEKKAIMCEATQAYPGKTGEDKDDAESDTSEEFVLDDEDNAKGDDEDVSQIFMAPTLACDGGEDSNQSEESGESIQEMETQAFAEDQTQVVEEPEKKSVKSDDATQVFTDGATQVIDDSSKTGKKDKKANDGETQVFTDETQVFDDEKKAIGGKGKTGDDPTQVFTDETQVFDQVAETNKAGKGRKSSEEATQVFPDATIAVHENEDIQSSKRGISDNLNSDSEQPTQVFPDATMAVEDLCHQTKVKKKGKSKDSDNISEAETQVFQDPSDDSKEVKHTKKPRGRSKKRTINTGDTEAATQELGEMVETGTSASNRKIEKIAEGSKGPINEAATQMFSQGVEEDDSDRLLIIRAVATLAAEDNDHVDSDGEGKDKEIDSEATTQVVAATVAIVEAETVAVTEAGTVNVSDTVAITDSGNEGEIATLSLPEPQPTVPISDTEEKSKTKGRGRKGGKGKSKAKSSSEEAEAATQVLNDTETLPISEVEETVPKAVVKSQHGALDMEPATQIYSEDKKVVIDKDEDATQVINSAETEESTSRRSKRQKTNKSLDAKRQKIPEEDNTETVSTSGRQSRNRKGKQTSVDESSVTNAKDNSASTAGKRKRKTVPAVTEEATQKYVEEETQRYSDGEQGLAGRGVKGRSPEEEEDDLTPPLPDEMVPDSEEAVTSPIIPAPALVRIPSRSPHKSAMASPDKKKKSPSPKRVQFVSQGSEETEPPTRGRRGRKVVQMEIEDKSGRADDKKDSVTEIKPVGRKGRRSALTETKTDKGSKAKSGRKSLPAVLEPADSSKEDPGKSQEITKDKDSGEGDNEEKLPKGRKGKKAKQNDKMVDESKIKGSTSESEKLTEHTEQSVGAAKKPTAKRSTRNALMNGDSVTDKVEEEVSQVSSSGNNSTRQSSRSKTKLTDKVEKIVEPGTSKVTRTKAAERAVKPIDKNNESVEIPETSRRSRTRGKSEPEDDKPKNRGANKQENVSKNVDSEHTADDSQETGLKHKNVSNKSKTDIKSVGVLSENSQGRSDSTETNERQSRASRRKEKESESQNSQTDKTKTGDSSVSKSVKSRTSRRKGRSDSADNQTESGAITPNGDLREITNVKNHVKQSKSKVKETKGSDQNQKASKVEGTVGKLTRGKVATTSSGSGDADQTPAKRRKTTVPEPQAVTTPKTTNRRATIATVSTPKQNAGKALEGTPKGGNKKMDTSITNSPSLRKTDHVKPKVMFTGVTDEQCEKIVKELGGELVTSVYDCTHLVTDQVRRTVKFLCCLSRGVPIMTPQWLMSSKRTSVFSDPAPFLIQDHASEKKFKFSLQLSLDKATEKPFLSDYKIHVTKSVKPEPNQMKDIIQCAGAKYVSTMPKSFSDQTVVISCEDDKAVCDGAIRAGIPVVSSEFILTGALRQEADLTSYRLFANGDKRKQSVVPDGEPNSKKRKR